MNPRSVATVQSEGAMDAAQVIAACTVCRSREIEQVDREINLCRCCECGFVFDSPRPGEAAIVAFYSQQGKYDSWVDGERARGRLWRRRLKKLLPHRVPGNLLDVGTGTGQFLHHAKPHFTEVEGTEVSESAVRIARERYSLDIHHGRVEELNLPARSYDNITLFHVLEHVHDPAELANKCCELLRPGGVLVIAVPNDVLAWGSGVKRAGRKLGLPAFRKFSPVLGIAKAGASKEVHLSHFTPAVLRKLITGRSFTVTEEGLDPYYAATGLLRIAHRCYYAFHRAMFSVSGCNRYETIWLIARKKAEPSSCEPPLRCAQ